MPQHALVLHSIKDHVLIDFVGEDQNILVSNEHGELIVVGLVQYAAAWVVR